MIAAVKSRIQSLAKVLLFWVLFYGLFIAVSAQSGAIFPTQVHKFVVGIAGTLIVILITWLFIKSENKTFADYGLVWEKTSLVKFFKGLIIGILALGVVIALSVLFAGFTIQRNPEGYSEWMPLLYLAIIPAVLMEEIAYRAYPLLKLNHAFGLRLTQVIVMIAFALHHIPLGWSVLGAFTGPGVWALIFGVAAVQSKGIALPVGMHIGTNLVQSVLGMNKGIASYWIVARDDSTGSLIASLSIRFLILLIALFLTEFYIRRGRPNHQKESKSNVNK